jgi:hypothetical protein
MGGESRYKNGEGGVAGEDEADEDGDLCFLPPFLVFVDRPCSISLCTGSSPSSSRWRLPTARTAGPSSWVRTSLLATLGERVAPAGAEVVATPMFPSSAFSHLLVFWCIVSHTFRGPQERAKRWNARRQPKNAKRLCENLVGRCPA